MKFSNHTFLFFILFFGTFTLSASNNILSGKAEISLLTCDPGDQVYSLFGHTAIRVKDPENRLDIVFNYGTFDFRTQGFYFKFAQGSLPYILSCSRFSAFMDEYRYEKRSVYEQIINLDSIHKQRLWEMLEENYKPENRTYYYNFLYDNCTTRARDIISKSLDGNIFWSEPSRSKSFWNLLDEYLEVSPWTQWGIHTILGSPAKATASVWEQMFLPDYLMYGVDSASLLKESAHIASGQVSGKDSAHCSNQVLAHPIRTIYQAPKRENNTSWFLSPFFIFLIASFMLIGTLQRFRSPKLLKGIAIPLFLVTGIIGCLLIFLGYFTLHPTTAPNFNLLWANPLNLIVAFSFFKKKMPGIIRKYLYVYFCLLLAGFLLWVTFTPAVVYSTMVLIALMIYLTYRLWQLKA